MNLTEVGSALALMGPYWSQTYDGREQVLALAGAASVAAQQRQLDTTFRTSYTSRQTAQPYRRVQFLPWTVRASSVNQSLGSVITHDSGLRYNQGYRYGDVFRDQYALAAPAGLRGFTGITNRITDASRCWIDGVDCLFDAQHGVIRFKENPFGDPAVIPRAIGDDQEITLWLVDAELDLGDIYEQFGFAFEGRPGIDGAIQKPAVLAVADIVVGGTNLHKLKNLIAAATGIPKTEQDETVETVFTRGGRQVVVTDKSVYRLPAGAAGPAAGAVLPAGTFLSDAVQLWEVSRTIPDWIRGLRIGQDLLGGGVSQPLFFANREVPVVTTADGPQFHVGTPDATAGFFREFARRLADVDLTVTDVLESLGGAAVPTGINPFEFLSQQWLRGSLLLLQLTPAAMQSHNVYLLNHLRKFISPHTLLMTVLALQPQRTSFTIAAPTVSAGTAANPNRAPLTLSPRFSARYTRTPCP